MKKKLLAIFILFSLFTIIFLINCEDDPIYFYGYECKPGTVDYYNHSDEIEECDLLKDEVIQGIRLKAGTRIYLNRAGKLERCRLKEDTMINEIPCKAGTKEKYYLDGTVEFHTDGKIESCRLSKDAVIQGIPCKMDIHVDFFESGSIESCTLSNNSDIQGVPCKANYNVNFCDSNKNPSVNDCILYKDYKLEKILCKKDMEIDFNSCFEFNYCEYRN